MDATVLSASAAFLHEILSPFRGNTKPAVRAIGILGMAHYQLGHVPAVSRRCGASREQCAVSWHWDLVLVWLTILYCLLLI